MKYFILSGLIVPGIVACNQKQTEVKPQMKKLTTAVYASGVLVPEDEYKVVAATEGFLDKSMYREGDTVSKGAFMFSLSNVNQQAQVQTAEALVEKTRPVASPNSPMVSELNNRLAAAKIRLKNDSIQYVRYKALYDQNAISASNYDRYKLQYETSQRDVATAEQQLSNQKLSSAIQLQEANNKLQVAKATKSNGIVKSFADGIIYDIYKQTGDMVYANQPIALIGSGPMIAKLSVDEDDLGKISVGQNVLITMDAYPDKVFKATIKKIYPLLNKIEQSFRVDAVFAEEIPIKLYGLNIEANIVVSQNQAALVVPRKALLKGDSVMIKEDGKITKVKVTRGAEDSDWVQIKTGLDINSTLIVTK
ncbi:MAG: RND transporter [Bacteroidetes bacterium]|nr:MAG: RND transporter [Bacteroidota bacterium]